MSAYLYILAKNYNGALYIGVTNSLSRRVWEHKQGVAESHTKRYDVKKLVYYEIYDRIEDAIAREKAMKKWHRDWKIKRIELENPNWLDLYQFLNG